MDDDAPDHDSGPFCRHWGSPSDCERMCTCGHPCTSHGASDDQCEECDCATFTDDPDGPPPFASKPAWVA